MPSPTNKISLSDAEANLKGLEQHIHTADLANSHVGRHLRRAEEDAEVDPEAAKQHLEKAEAATQRRDSALKAHADSGVTDRDIDEAAQMVLDARGETHSEVNILPPGVSIDEFNKSKAEAV